MKKIIFTLFFELSFVISLFAQPGSVENGNHSLNSHSHYFNNHILQLAYDTAACGLNYTQSTSMITTRYNQYSQSAFGHGFPDTLSITGLPNNYTIAKAYIYFLESYTTACNNPIVTFSDPSGNVHNAGAVLVGSDGPVCWGETGSYGFRADVTNSITTNGLYILDSISCTSVWEIDGASLLVVYQDLDANYEGTFVLNDGCVSIDGGSEATTLAGFNVCQNSLYGRGFVISGDFQDNVGPHLIIINNDTVSFPSLFMNFDDTLTDFISGQSIANMGAISPGDCYIIGAAGIYYKDTCIVCPSLISGINTAEFNEFSINPNPTEGLLTISAASELNNTIHLSLINVLGQEIINQNWNPVINGATTKIDIQNCSNGVYYLILQSQDRKIFFKIVKD